MLNYHLVSRCNLGDRIGEITEKVILLDLPSDCMFCRNDTRCPLYGCLLGLGYVGAVLCDCSCRFLERLQIGAELEQRWSLGLLYQNKP